MNSIRGSLTGSGLKTVWILATLGLTILLHLITGQGVNPPAPIWFSIWANGMATATGEILTWFLITIILPVVLGIVSRLLMTKSNHYFFKKAYSCSYILISIWIQTLLEVTSVYFFLIAISQQQPGQALLALVLIFSTVLTGNLTFELEKTTLNSAKT